MSYNTNGQVFNTLITAFIIMLLLFSYLFLTRYDGLEPDTVYVPPLERADSLNIPPRPGIQGVVIAGPVIKDLVFDIDLRAADVTPLSWDKLEGIDRTAEITVRATVTENGHLRFTRRDRDIIDRGHPEASRYIERILSTWTYFPYKTGTLRFYFNVASKGEKLVIDTRGMRKKETIPDKIRVQNGLLYHISGLPQDKVGYRMIR